MAWWVRGGHLSPPVVVSDEDEVVVEARRKHEEALVAVAAGEAPDVDVLPEASWEDYEARPRRRRRL